jgi:hypothetical protein
LLAKSGSGPMGRQQAGQGGVTPGNMQLWSHQIK